jgi:hypothetical protein
MATTPPFPDTLATPKKQGRPGGRPWKEKNFLQLEADDVRGLKAFGAFGNLELNGYAVFQRAEAIPLDGGVMDEDIVSGHPLDEAEALAGVKPLHSTLFFFAQLLTPKVKFMRLDSYRLSGQQKRPPAWTCRQPESPLLPWAGWNHELRLQVHQTQA